MARRKKMKAYFDQSWLISLILAIFPLTNILFGILFRLQSNNVLMCVLNFVVFPLFYIVDLISFLLHGDLNYLV